MSDPRFPQELLSKSKGDRLQYFKDRMVAHPRLVEAYSDLRRSIEEPGGASLIFVFGPPGVGKTTLRMRLEVELSRAALPELERDPGRFPAVAMEVVAPESGNFNWRDHYTRMLEAL